MTSTSGVQHGPQSHPDLYPAVGLGSQPALPQLAVEAATWMSLLECSRGHRASRLLYCLVLKRWCDVVVACLLLIALLPLYVVVALAIWLDSGGPILFRQSRVGKDGHLFSMYKFRTMIPDRRRAHLPYDGPERRRRHKTLKDPRVTRVGQLLRRTSIDELPQLINVLCGQMSLVGPRPELPEIVTRYADWQHQRHLVRPGITGWWQVNGRSDLPLHEHTDLDLYYVINQSFALDVSILLRTFRAVTSRAGAF